MAKAVSEPFVGTPAKPNLFPAAFAQLSERQAEFRTGKILIPISAGSADFFPQGFDPASVVLALQAFFLGIAGGAGGFSFLGCGEYAFNEIPKSDQGITPVFSLGAVLLRLDDDDAFPRDAMIIEIQKTFLEVIGKR